MTNPSPLQPQPDPRQVAYHAVFAYLRHRPADPSNNHRVWQAVHIALNAADIGEPVDIDGYLPKSDQP